MPELIRLLLVGSFHMASPGRDFANPDIDDVQTTTRQQEIERVVEAIGTFAPTRVAVEFPRANQAKLDAAYRRYRDDQVPLGRSEVAQLGFRLAARAGLGTVDAIDVTDQFWVAGIDELAGRDPTARGHLDELKRSAAEAAQETQERVAQRSIGDALRAENMPHARQAALRPYMEHLVPIASGKGEYPGAEATGNWYGRNFKIAANLMTICSPGDRVAVIYGSGHLPVLEHIFDTHPGYELVDPLDYLGPAAS